jgi:alpha-D-ribose 1-methylphosphonate 5-triphosphate synthase subunit PhnH
VNVAISAASLRLDADRSRAAFRLLMSTLSEPGRVLTLPYPWTSSTHPSVLLALVLADVDVSIGADAGVPEDVLSALREATGANVTPLHEAQLCLLHAADPESVLSLRRGSALAPEDGARVAVRVRDLAVPGPESPASAGQNVLDLAGPGVDGLRSLTVDWCGPDLSDALAAANAAFPAGIDTWLFSDTGRVAAIPRSSRITTRRP